MKKIAPRSACPVSHSLDIFGDKWTLLILRDMMIFGKYSYSEFLASNEKIASNILIDRLSLLHANGFIDKHTSPSKKSKNFYTLTDKGIGIFPILVAIALWAKEFSPFTMPESIDQALQNDKEKAIGDFTEKLKKEREILLENIH